jgi:glutamate racemase
MNQPGHYSSILSMLPVHMRRKMEQNKQDLSERLPIGIFDSGVGGLSVARVIHSQLPSVSTIYLGDQAHVPYGSRSIEQVRAFSEEITRFLLGQDARLIVVACNAASASALHHLRQHFPDIPFVGMEPAIKPAAENTRSGVVGVLATPATFQGELYASVVERFAKDVTIMQSTCPGLVAQIEAGKLDDPATIAILRNAIEPMLEKGIDTIVLGCTHYPFVIPQIKRIAGNAVRVIDPAPAIARQTARLLQERGWLVNSETIGRRDYFTSGELDKFEVLAANLIGRPIKAQKVTWGKELTLPS